MENFSPEAIIKKSDMKKIYVTPQMEVVEIASSVQLLAGSTPGYGGGGNADPQAPEFDLDDYDWVDKGYQFGDWDIE